MNKGTLLPSPPLNPYRTLKHGAIVLFSFIWLYFLLFVSYLNKRTCLPMNPEPMKAWPLEIYLLWTLNMLYFGLPHLKYFSLHRLL